VKKNRLTHNHSPRPQEKRRQTAALQRTTMPASWFAILAAIISGTVQFVVFLRWLHRRMRNDEIVSAFVRDIAANHLPHIYTALHEIAKRQGIELPETPMVRFVDLNGHRRNS
jgi:uncharacterized protein involved in response to NO